MFDFVGGKPLGYAALALVRGAFLLRSPPLRVMTLRVSIPNAPRRSGAPYFVCRVSGARDLHRRAVSDSERVSVPALSFFTAIYP